MANKRKYLIFLEGSYSQLARVPEPAESTTDMPGWAEGCHRQGPGVECSKKKVPAINSERKEDP